MNAPESPPPPERLTTSSFSNPLGIDDRAPLFRWRLPHDGPVRESSAWRVLAATSPDLLAHDEGDVWDSGKVEAPGVDSAHYHGAPLDSRQRYWWKVRVWDEAGKPSAWSEPAFWEMGLLRA